ncbi:MAG: asparagine synthetase B [Clostridiales bacterium]|nr:asparagine synthetase B [Clostridiales bacterium]
MLAGVLGLKEAAHHLYPLVGKDVYSPRREVALGAKGPWAKVLTLERDPRGYPLWVAVEGILWYGEEEGAEGALRAFLEKGEGFLSHLTGPFTLVLFDGHAQKVILYRSRQGVETLFLAQGPGFLLFASDEETLFQGDLLIPRVSLQGWRELLALGPLRIPGHTYFQGVRELLPGEGLIWSPEGERRLQVNLPIGYRRDLSPQEAAEELLFRLQRAVKRLFRPKSGCLLSGGLDSSAIASLLAEETFPLLTLSLRYEDDERHFQANPFQPSRDDPYVRQMVAWLQTRHEEALIGPEDLVDHLLPAMEARGHPGMADIDSSFLVLLIGAREKADGFFTGEGADEILGGYPWFSRPYSPEEGRFPWSAGMEWRERLVHPDLRPELRLSDYGRRELEEAWRSLPPPPEDEPPLMWRLSHLTYRYFGPVLVERARAMARKAGVKIFLPFLDEEVVSFALSLPWELKAQGGMEKGVLRQAFVGRLPEEVRLRKKSPFPRTFHPRYRQLVTEALEAILADPEAPSRRLFAEGTLRAWMAAPGDLEVPWFGQLMRLPQLFGYVLQVEGWLRRWGLKPVV